MNFFLNKNIKNIENMCFNTRHLTWEGGQYISKAGEKKKNQQAIVLMS